MAKQKRKKVHQERLSVLLETIFEDDGCMSVRVSNPNLSHAKLGSLGCQLINLQLALERKEKIQGDMDRNDKLINDLMYGDRS